MVNKKTSIHNFEKRVEQAQNCLKQSKISDKNKQFILDFVNSGYGAGIGNARISKYLSSLKIIAETIKKDFDNISNKDITTFLANNEKKDYSEWTKQNYKVMIKKFYTWLSKQTKDKRYTELVEDIKTTIPKTKLKLPSDLLTEEEILKLIDNAQTIRDKALISLLYETGARIDEIGSMQLRDLMFDKDGAVVILSGKTGMRRVRVISSEVLLKQYLKIRDGSKNPEEPLWLTNKGGQITYGAITKTIRATVKRADINKKVHPHLFRHSRATFLANRLTEAQLNNYLGWTQGSSMSRVYVHMSGRDVDSAILEMYGKKEKQEVKESKMNPIACPRCKENNSAGASFCYKCGAPLSVQVAIKLEERRKEAEDVMNFILKDDKIKQIIAEKIKEY
jgi:integrase/recombinase XerD